ncbi:MAG: hypothetical protein QM817_27285 [Archangium sp.]
MSEDRELRDALEKAQARVRELESRAASEQIDADEAFTEQESYIQMLESLLKQEADARNELGELVEKMRGALDDTGKPTGPMITPAEHRQVVRLRAEVAVQKLTISRLEETVAALRSDLDREKKKKK